jgi:hypothetical protein
VTWKNGSTTRFGYCRNENDVYQYQGAEFLFIGIDELTHFTLKQWQFLTSRNRCAIRKYTAGKNKGKEIFPCMAGATNPGNIGHAWVKALWVDKVPPPGCESAEQYHAEDYEFIRVMESPIHRDPSRPPPLHPQLFRSRGVPSDILVRCIGIARCRVGKWRVMSGPSRDLRASEGRGKAKADPSLPFGMTTILKEGKAQVGRESLRIGSW